MVFSGKDEGLMEELLLASVGSASGLVALVILEFDKVDDWEKLRVLDVGFARAGEEGFKSVLLALVDVLDITKEVVGGSLTVLALMKLDRGGPVEFVEEADVMLIGNEVNVDKVPNAELELLIDPTELDLDEA